MSWLSTTGLRALLAVSLSLALWFFVAYTENPDRRTTFNGVPVEIEGVAPGLVAVDANGAPRIANPTIDLTVEAPQETLQTLKQSDFRAFVDLTSKAPGESIAPVQVVATRGGLQLARFVPVPENVGVRLEREITRTLPLDIQVSGSVPFSYVAEQPVSSVGGVTVTEAAVRGPQNRVERVARLRVAVDIDRLTANYRSPRPLEPVTEGGQVVAGVSVTPGNVEIFVPISSNVGVKRVPVVPAVTGFPAAGYVVSGITVEPQFVGLTGSSGPLDAAQNAGTLPLTLSGINSDSVFVVPIVPPRSTLLQSGEPVTATVRVTVQQLPQQYSVTLPVPVQVVEIPGGLELSLSPNVVSVTIGGAAAAMSALDTAQLTGTVSARGLSFGTTALTPTLTLPPGVSVIGSVPQVRLTLRPPPTAAPTLVPTAALTEQPNGTPRPGTTETPVATGTPRPAGTETPAGTATPRPAGTETPTPTAAGP